MQKRKRYNTARIYSLSVASRTRRLLVQSVHVKRAFYLSRYIITTANRPRLVIMLVEMGCARENILFSVKYSPLWKVGETETDGQESQCSPKREKPKTRQ